MKNALIVRAFFFVRIASAIKYGESQNLSMNFSGYFFGLFKMSTSCPLLNPYLPLTCPLYAPVFEYSRNLMRKAEKTYFVSTAN